MGKREFLQLAHTFNLEKHRTWLGGWFASEKLDGMRCFWDGGISRGLSIDIVPWANTDKAGRLVDKVYATGLWSRYGIAIRAPNFWLDQLPPGIPLDGELYLGRQRFEDTVSITKSFNAGDRWNEVQYKVFDAVPYATVFADGKLTDARYTKVFKGIKHPDTGVKPERAFDGRQKFLKFNVPENKVVSIHVQDQLPFTHAAALEAAQRMAAEVDEAGGEGVMLKNRICLWEAERCWTVLKMKPWHDAEGVVTGYVSGRETDKGSKLLGMMGALILEIKRNGDGEKCRLELSGFTDKERAFAGARDVEWATYNPGLEAPDWVRNPTFPIGSTVTFKYREYSADGIPKEARYFRVRSDD